MTAIERLVLCKFGLLFLVLGCSSPSVAEEGATHEIDQKLLFSMERSTEPSKKLEGPSGIQISLSSDHIYDGSILLADVTIPESKGATAETKKVYKIVMGEVDFPLIPVDETAGTFLCVLAVAHNTKAGKIQFNLVLDPSQKEPKMTFSVDISEGRYKSEKLQVAGRTVNPKKKDLVRIKKESTEISHLYREIRREKLWSGPFILPIESPITSPYGTKRVYNGEMQGFHQGLDLKAAVGTPIYSPAGGVVVLAKDLFFTGKTVILDHGFGIFTVYGHMSRLKIKKGKRVNPKTLLGLAGATGRASGPHLHWGAVLQRIKVNPLDLLRVIR